MRTRAGVQLAASHEEVGEALRVAGAALDAGTRPPSVEELWVCEGLCTLVTTQQAAQDQELFPRVAARRPDLGPVLRSLREQHARVAALVRDLREACAGRKPVDDLQQRVGELRVALLAHFAEERQQLGFLEGGRSRR